MRIKSTKARNHYDSIEFSPECLPCKRIKHAIGNALAAWFVASRLHSRQGSQLAWGRPTYLLAVVSNPMRVTIFSAITYPVSLFIQACKGVISELGSST